MYNVLPFGYSPKKFTIFCKGILHFGVGGKIDKLLQNFKMNSQISPKYHLVLI